MHHPSKNTTVPGLHHKHASPLMAHASSRLERLALQLYQRIAQLEMENEQFHYLRWAFPDLAQRYQNLTDTISQIFYTLDEKGFVLAVNPAVAAWGDTPEEWIGHLLAERVDERDRARVARAHVELVAARQDQTHAHLFRLRAKTGEIRWIEARCTIRFSGEGRFLWCQGVCRDITPAGAPEAVADQASPRIQQLAQVNEALQRKIDEYFTTEKALRDREAELEMERANLQEANTALKVLLKRREEDKRALEEQVMYNVKKLVLPFLSKVQAESLDERHKSYLGIVESNLRDITCGFSRRLSLGYYGLSTAELKVANFIRQGKKNREIADLLGLSIRTVEAYRQSIRNKLRLQNKKVNLCTFLMSIN